MPFLVHAPPPALAPFVACLWHHEADTAWAHARERVLPGGTMQLLVNLHEDELRSYHGPEHRELRRTRGAALGGPGCRPVVIDTAEQRRIVGVSFKPGGAYPFFTAPADALREQDVELDLLWGRDGASLRERLLEQPTPAACLQLLARILVARVARPLTPDRAIHHAVAALERGDPVAAVGERLGLSPRRLIDRFSAQVGLTPKRFARVRRFQRLVQALARGAAPPWAELAVACGYYDQAHLIHEFAEFSGLQPTAYQPSAPHAANHVVLTD
ncbi:MAG: AraC family transcriptional regulator [Myxococcales bacterium]|nr:AraC family transcriptional regulator [Myxococcales bacterium]